MVVPITLGRIILISFGLLVTALVSLTGYGWAQSQKAHAQRVEAVAEKAENGIERLGTTFENANSSMTQRVDSVTGLVTSIDKSIALMQKDIETLAKRPYLTKEQIANLIRESYDKLRTTLDSWIDRVIRLEDRVKALEDSRK